MSTLSNHLVIFAKAPRMGRVKSRLAQGLGGGTGRVAAWQFYRANLQDKINILSSKSSRPLPWKTWIALTPDTGHLPDTPSNVTTLKQGSGDLGQRMGRMFQNLPAGPVVIIGTDIPAITSAHIRQAFKALGARDCVFGPATDGGYWLVGMKRRPHAQLNAARHIFANVRWSSEHALIDTCSNMQRRGLSIAMLEPLEDIDDAESYERWITGAR